MISFHRILKKALPAFVLIVPLVGNAQNGPLQDTQYRPQARDASSGMNYQNSPNYQANYAGYESYEGNGCGECCDTGCCFWDTIKVPLIGVVAGIGGGLIGGAISSSNGHDGHDGDPGATGATGATGPGFTADTGQSLTFILTSLFPASTPGAVTVIPFVTRPDGITIEGAPLVAPAAGGTVVFPALLVTDPVFGFYNFGLSIANTSSTTLAGITLNGTLVNASRDASSTNELTPLAGVSIAPGESQISSTFTYDSANIP